MKPTITVKSKKKPYWYFFTFSECVMCGHQDDYKTRQYTPKPKNRNDRYSYRDFGFNCHFYA